MIVLATLGVYFGLILCGAATQVLASAAMARSFDVRDEIEIRDEFDTLPADERSPVSTSVQVYIEDIERFLSSLARLRAEGKFDPNVDSFSVAQNALLPCLHSNKAGRYTPIRFITSTEFSRPALEYFSREMVYGYSLGDCLVNNEFNGITAVDSRFEVELDRQALSIRISVKKGSRQGAAVLVRQLEATRQLYSGNITQIRKTVLKGTTFRAFGDQVLVITRLPRSGLVPLFTA